MIFFRSLGVRGRVLAPWSLLGALLAWDPGTSSPLLGALSALEAMRSQCLESVRELSRVEANLAKAKGNVRPHIPGQVQGEGMQVTADVAEWEVEQWSSQCRDLIGRLKDSPLDPFEAERLEALEAAVEEWDSVRGRTLELAREGGGMRRWPTSRRRSCPPCPRC